MDVNQILVGAVLWGTITLVIGFFIGAKIMFNRINKELEKKGLEIDVKWYLKN